jgi:hypothetical protein
MADVIVANGVETKLTYYCAGDATRDYWTNTVYHTIKGEPWPIAGTDWQNHANQVLAAFMGTASEDAAFQLLVGFHATAEVFDMTEPGSKTNPRQPKAVATHTPAMPVARSSCLPSQLAACLSWGDGVKAPGHYGRVYVGLLPFGPPGWSGEGPLLSAGNQAEVLSLGNALFNVGGENVAHVIVHRALTKGGLAAGSTSVISTYWASNEYATVRRRAVRSTSRVILTP